MLRIFICTLALVSTVNQAAERPKIGLALSGGGARGAAHIGVLKELERQRIPVDYIAGTSIGSILGGMYAAGMTTDDMERVLTSTDWDDIFKDQPPRTDSSLRRKFDDQVFQINKELGIRDGKIKLPSGFIQGQKLQLLLDTLFLPVADVGDFDQLSIPFRAVATDITTSEAAVLGTGSIATAIRASMSVPAIFATVKYQDRILVDGGISNNLPIDVVRDMGADIVIAVDIGTPLLEKDQLESALGVASQLTNILVRRTTNAQIATLGEQDILITPELGLFSAADFKGADILISKGVEATLALAERLKPMAAAQNEYDQYFSNKDRADKTPPVISFIRIENDSLLSDEFIRYKLQQQLGKPLDFQQLDRDIGIIYGLEIFQTVNYRVVHEANESGLVVNVQQKPWGPKYLQFGLRYSSDFSVNNNLAVRLGYTITPLNIWNGEWRSILQLGEEPGLATEFNQPLGIGSPYYVNGQLMFSNERFNTFADGVKINETRVRKFGATGALGREFGRWGDLRLGVSRFTSENRAELGAPDAATSDIEGGEVFALFRLDTLDSVFFPTEGMLGSVGWVGSRSELGADNDFDQALFDFSGAASWGAHTVLLGARYLSTVKGEAPIQSGFRLGGLFNLPGFVENELSGQNLYLLRSAYQRKLANLFNTSPYLGVTLQYGQVFQNEDDVSLADGIVAGGIWLGWDSFLGPVFLGYGRAETDNQSVYLIFGSQF